MTLVKNTVHLQIIANSLLCVTIQFKMRQNVKTRGLMNGYQYHWSCPTILF